MISPPYDAVLRRSKEQVGINLISLAGGCSDDDYRVASAEKSVGHLDSSNIWECEKNWALLPIYGIFMQF
jgi:hypothetical protein